MWDSLAGWKCDPKLVTKELKKLLKSESAKYHAVKENIMICVKGFGWDWSKDGRKYTVFELKKKDLKYHLSYQSIFLIEWISLYLVP